MLSGGGNGQGVDTLFRDHLAGDALHTVVRDVRHPDVTVLRLAAADGGKAAFHRVQQRVVAVEDQGAAFL